jgi:hypothetical protein
VPIHSSMGLETSFTSPSSVRACSRTMPTGGRAITWVLRNRAAATRV